MIEFKNHTLTGLKENSIGYEDKITAILTTGESLFGIYKNKQKIVVFTNKRLLLIDAKGFGGKKTDLTSVTYNRVSIFSSTIYSNKPSLELFVTEIGKLVFEFNSDIDIKGLYRQISEILCK